MARQTRKQRVIKYLIARKGQWVPGYELTTPEVGGSEGLRRLREACKDGWGEFVEKRPMSGSDAWEYRINDR